MFENLSPTQRRVALIGLPAVGGLVLARRLAGGDAGDDVEVSEAEPTVVTAPNTDAIGVGQLADFETSITAYLLDLKQDILDYMGGGTQPPPATDRPPIGTLSNAELKAECGRINGAGSRAPRYTAAAVYAEMRRRDISVNRLTGPCRRGYVNWLVGRGQAPPAAAPDPVEALGQPARRRQPTATEPTVRRRRARKTDMGVPRR